MRLAIALGALALAAACSSVPSPDQARCSDVILAVNDWQKGVKTDAEMRAVLSKTYDRTASTKTYHDALGRMLAAMNANDAQGFADAGRSFGLACDSIMGN